MKKLNHVFWLCGGACAGKTTMKSLFMERLNFKTVEDDILKYRSLADKEKFPAIQMPNPTLNWDQWFNRPPEIHGQWMLDVSKELTFFMLEEIKESDPSTPLIIDLGVDVAAILPYIPKENIVGLFTDAKTIRSQYLYRPDHEMILKCIEKNTKNPKETAANVSESVCWFSEKIKASCSENGIYCFQREESTSKEAQFEALCTHFNF